MNNHSAFAIETEGLTKRFRGAAAVDELSLCVPRGTTLGLLGPNGAGKSTTLRMLMGMLRKTSGSTRVLGLDPVRDARALKQRVGYVPEMLFRHNIFVPFMLDAKFNVIEIVPEGDYTLKDTIATIDDEEGNRQDLQMVFDWPVKKAMPFHRRSVPTEPMPTIRGAAPAAEK